MGGTGPLLELAVGLALLVSVILLHGVGLRWIGRRFGRAWARGDLRRSRWRADLLLAAVVGALAALHLAETFAFAAPLYATGVVPDLRDAYYYVLQCYTTLGEGPVVLPEAWRLIGPIISMAGLFTFGWTTGVLVGIMSQVGRLDLDVARAEALEERGGRPG